MENVSDLLKNAVTETIAIKDAFVNTAENFREEYDLDSLKAIIRQDGGILKQPWIWRRPDGVLEVLQGCRRFSCAEEIEAETPGFFTDASLSCLVFEELEPSEVLALRFDHTGQKALSGKVELYRAQKAHILAGIDQTRLAILMSPVFYSDLSETEAGRKTKRSYDEAAAISDLSERNKAIKEVWRGQLQAAEHKVKLPAMVEEMWLLEHRGEEVPFHVSDSMLTNLRKAFNADKAAAKAAGTERPTRDNPGEKFLAKWQSFFTKAEEAAAVKESTGKAPRRRTVSAIDDAQDVYASKAVKLALEFSEGKEVPGLPDADKNAFLAEKMAELLPDKWKGMVAEVEDLLK